MRSQNCYNILYHNNFDFARDMSNFFENFCIFFLQKHPKIVNLKNTRKSACKRANDIVSSVCSGVKEKSQKLVFALLIFCKFFKIAAKAPVFCAKITLFYSFSKIALLGKRVSKAPYASPSRRTLNRICASLQKSLPCSLDIRRKICYNNCAREREIRLAKREIGKWQKKPKSP